MRRRAGGRAVPDPCPHAAQAAALGAQLGGPERVSLGASWFIRRHLCAGHDLEVCGGQVSAWCAGREVARVRIDALTPPSAASRA